jgi:hypothetical protein
MFESVLKMLDWPPNRFRNSCFLPEAQKNRQAAFLAGSVTFHRVAQPEDHTRGFGMSYVRSVPIEWLILTMAERGENNSWQDSSQKKLVKIARKGWR